jgi:hypothetical protein
MTGWSIKHRCLYQECSLAGLHCVLFKVEVIASLSGHRFPGSW